MFYLFKLQVLFKLQLNFIYKSQQKCSTLHQCEKFIQLFIMKFLIVLQIILSFGSFRVYCQNESIYVEAISQIITRHEFIKGATTMHLTCSTNNPTNELFFDVMSAHIMQRLKLSIAYRYQDVRNLTIGRTKLETNVIFITNLEDFKPIDDYIDKNYFKFQACYLIVFLNEANLKDIGKLLNIMWTHQIVNVNVLVPRNKYKELRMYTYFPFTPFACGKVHPIMINKFSRNSFSSPPPFFKSKVRNFHKCPIRIATFHAPPIIIVKNTTDGQIKLGGIDGNLIQVLSENLNFKINPIITKDMWGFNYRNGTVTGASGLIVDGKADLAVGKFVLERSRKLVMKSSLSYFSSSVCIVVPVGQPFSDMEILMMPFRYKIWLLVVGLAITTVLVIAFIKWKLQRDQQKFIMGSTTTTPYFNTIVALIGQNLPPIQVPGRNFARTMLCILMLYALVVRSAYTGALFKFIQKDNFRHETVQHVTDMTENGFMFYMTESTQTFVQDIPQIYENRVIYKPGEELKLLKMILNPDSKGGVIELFDQILYYNKLNHNEFFLNFVKLYTVNYVIYMTKNSYLRRATDDFLLTIASNGLYNKFSDEYIQMKYMKEEPDVESEPKPLNLDQLIGCFKILIFGIFLSIIVFAIEVLLPKMKRLFMWSLSLN